MSRLGGNGDECSCALESKAGWSTHTCPRHVSKHIYLAANRGLAVLSSVFCFRDNSSLEKSYRIPFMNRVPFSQADFSGARTKTMSVRSKEHIQYII